MVLFTLSFTLGVWLLQQQAALPDFVWAWLLLGIPLLYPLARWRERVRERDVEREHHFQYPIILALRTVLIAVFACGLGFYQAAWQAQQRLSISLADEWQGRDIAVVGVVAELPHLSERGLRFSFDVEQTLTPLAQVPPHIYLSTYTDDKTPPLAMHAGERWQLTLRLKQPHGSSNPHGSDFEIWALENKVRAVGYVHAKGDNHRIAARADGMLYRIESWRETVRDKFNSTLTGAPYVGVLGALAIGDQSSIPQSQWQVFTRTGVNHLMSI